MARATITRKIQITETVSGDLPAYVPTTPFQSRALSGIYAPTNGNTYWSDPVSADWKSPAAGSMQNMQRAISIYSGGYSDPGNRLLMGHGGGHGDGAYNGILVFDLKGTTAPTGWTVLAGSESALVDVPTTNDIDHTIYLDGKAGSIHSYDGMAFDETSGQLFRFNGSYWKKGTMGDNASSDWTFGSGAWTAKPRDFGFGSVDTALCHDHPGRRALIAAGGVGRFYDFATETFGASFSPPQFQAVHSACVYDPTRQRAIMFGNDGGTRRLFHTTVDWGASTIDGWSTWTAGGDSGVFDGQAPGAFYDALLDRFWFFGSRGQTFDSLYWIAAADFSDGTVTVHEEPLTGDAPIGYTGGFFFGLFKRFCFVPEWRAVAVVTTYEQPVHIIKLPSA